MMRRVIILLLVVCLLVLAVVSVPHRPPAMNYEQVVAFGDLTGFRPATPWEIEHLDSDRLKRLVRDGREYPWLFVEIGDQ